MALNKNENPQHFLVFGVLSALFMNVALFWDIARRSPCVIFDTEDGGDTLLWNVTLHKDYTN
jgi:hypothetical protein